MSSRAAWSTMDASEREVAYSPSSCLPGGDYRPYVAEYRHASEAAWSAVSLGEDVDVGVISYGSAASRTVHLAVPAAAGVDTPLLVYLHGGYWQELSVSDSRFAAQDCIERGWGFAAVDYTLAPAATVGEIVDECIAAVRLLVGRGRLVVAGSSAGAHLAALVALAVPEVSAQVLVSGVYDLEPLVGTSINEALGLDVVAARELSPARQDLRGAPPAVVAVGEVETSEFIAQSSDQAVRLAAAGVDVTSLVVPGRNHFDVILDLARSGTLLGDTVAQLAHTPPPDER